MLLVLHVFDDDDNEVPVWSVDVSLSDDENNTPVPFDFGEGLAVINFNSIAVGCKIYEEYCNGADTLSVEGDEEIEDVRGL